MGVCNVEKKTLVTFNAICRFCVAFFTVFLLLISTNTYSQSEYVIIDSIEIIGNKKTSRQVITNEMDLHPGDTILLEFLAKRLSSNEKRLQSIGLFTNAKVNLKNWNTDLSTANVEIVIQENWYIYPYIIFELADRNFNVWRKEQNYSLERVNYGLALTHINFTGNKDKLKLKFQRGFTRKYEVSYEYPYLKKGWGFSTNFNYTENREIAYSTQDNKLLFYKNPDERKIFNQYRASIGLANRRNAFTFQNIRLEFISARVDSFIPQELNSNYFLDGKTKMRYFYVDYLFKFDNTLYPLYPIGGYRFDVNVRKEGLGIFKDVNNFWFTIGGERHTAIKKWLIISNRLKFKVNLQNNRPPYVLNSGLGYGSDNITGYQLYVLDGRDYILSKNAVKLRILDRDFKPSRRLPNQFKIMNVKLFFRFNLDYGYTRDPYYGPSNELTNTGQLGYGPALDLIVYNNFTLSCQLGVTQFGEQGFFVESGFNF
jgi:outer membrane protein assembly factor BamA